MLDSSAAQSMLGWEIVDIQRLPAAEDDDYEYKSSAVPDGELGNKIARAASGFWNSGGGIFIAGVDGRGRPDGGITVEVGRQSRRDWIDQHIGRTTPRGAYVVHGIEGPAEDHEVRPGHGVFLIGFVGSEFGPHMAPDDKYYVRAGAHTVPASHFIVESIRARRGLSRPLLRTLVRRKPGNYGVVQLGLVALTDAPAIDVELSIDPLPAFLENRRVEAFPLHIPVVNTQVPFFMDFHPLTLGSQDLPRAEIRLRYRDMLGREYDESSTVDVERQMGPGSLGPTDAQQVERRLGEIERAIKSVVTAIGKNEGHLRSIVGKLR